MYKLGKAKCVNCGSPECNSRAFTYSGHCGYYNPEHSLSLSLSLSISLSLSRSRCSATNMSSAMLLVENDELLRCGSSCAQAESPVLRTLGAM